MLTSRKRMSTSGGVHPVCSTALRTATVCAAPVAAPKPSHYVVGLSPWPSPFLTVLRLGPPRTQPRSTALRTATVCAAPVAALRPSHYAVGLSPWPSPFPTVLRLILGGHSRAPQPYGPRLCAQHQSLRPSNVHSPWDYPLAFALSYRSAAGPRRAQPRSTALRTATVCAAPVAAPKQCPYAVGLSP
jgi:hypothetical protein